MEAGQIPLAYGEVTDALEFLMEAKKNGAAMNIGKDVEFWAAVTPPWTLQEQQNVSRVLRMSA